VTLRRKPKFTPEQRREVIKWRDESQRKSTIILIRPVDYL
jgi:hypothetical protein